jgi:hypothetical protein
MEETLYTPSEGVLSTGIVYQFRGNFIFNEFRQEHNFYLERSTGNVMVAKTSAESAEAGQFYLFPALRNTQQPFEHIEGESSIIVVRYCPETDNWVLQIEFPAGTLLLGEPHIFTINRSTGNVIEFSANRGGVFIFEGRGGWRRTLNSSK